MSRRSKCYSRSRIYLAILSNEFTVSPLRFSASCLPLSLFLPFFFSLFTFWCCLSFNVNDRRHVSRHCRRHFGQFSINGSEFSLWSRTYRFTWIFFLFTPFVPIHMHTRTHTHTHAYTQSLPLSFSFFLSLTQIYVRVSIRLVISYWAIVKLYRIIRTRHTCEIDTPNKRWRRFYVG